MKLLYQKQNSARDDILKSLKAALKEQKEQKKSNYSYPQAQALTKVTPLPALAKNAKLSKRNKSTRQTYIRYPDKISIFSQIAKLVGAKVSTTDNVQQKISTLKKKYANKLIDTTQTNHSKNLALTYQQAEHCESAQIVLLKSTLAVAENGAVWINRLNENYIYHRSLLFFCDKIIVAVEKKSIVDNLYEAYQKIIAANKKSSQKIFAYGAFISGPSKTADVEQHLVIGAHAAKSLDIILY